MVRVCDDDGSFYNWSMLDSLCPAEVLPAFYLDPQATLNHRTSLHFVKAIFQVDLWAKVGPVVLEARRCIPAVLPEAAVHHSATRLALLHVSRMCFQ